MGEKKGKSGKDAQRDISAIDAGKCIAKEFPPGDVKAPEGELRVSIGRRAYDQIQKHAAEESEREICGVMLGDLCKDEAGPFLHITEVIRGEHTASQGAQVTITHETWSHFHKIKDNKFPDKEYLGWYHSHPDFGIFLSSMDLFIHENFFNAPHQVALVADPIRREEGLFFWKAGKAERAAMFWVGSQEHKYEPAPEPSSEQLALRELEKKVERVRMRLRGMDEFVRTKGEGGWMQTVLMLGILLLLLFMAWNLKTLGGAVEEQKKIDVEDAYRRKIVNVDYDRIKKVAKIRIDLLPEAFLVERQRDLATGQVQMYYRLDLAQIEKVVRSLEEARRKAREDSKKQEGDKESPGTGEPKDKSGEPGSGKAKNGETSGSGGVPHTSPVDPASGKPKDVGGAEGKGG